MECVEADGPVCVGVTALDMCTAKDLLVAGSEDGLLIAWNMRDLEVVCTILAHTGECE